MMWKIFTLATILMVATHAQFSQSRRAAEEPAASEVQIESTPESEPESSPETKPETKPETRPDPDLAAYLAGRRQGSNSARRPAMSVDVINQDPVPPPGGQTENNPASIDGQAAEGDTGTGPDLAAFLAARRRDRNRDRRPEMVVDPAPPPGEQTVNNPASIDGQAAEGDTGTDPALAAFIADRRRERDRERQSGMIVDATNFDPKDVIVGNDDKTTPPGGQTENNPEVHPGERINATVSNGNIVTDTDLINNTNEGKSCKQKTDIVLAVDMSGSVNDAGAVELVKQSAVKMIELLPINPAAAEVIYRVGVMMYSGEADTKIIFHLTDLTNAQSSQSMKTQIMAANIHHGQTHTDKALKLIREQMFTGSHVRVGAKKVLVIIADGEIWNSRNWHANTHAQTEEAKRLNQIDLKKQIDLLEADEVLRIGVGVGDKLVQFREQLKSVISKPKDQHYFEVKLWDSFAKYFPGLVSSKVTCPDVPLETIYGYVKEMNNNAQKIVLNTTVHTLEAPTGGAEQNDEVVFL
ncbi:uncharacterized protein LOC141907109 [Tubulanus polymorphus]|uniref:uncharacterized protein LOC141907109 n=1 Tax=Tubulanus polymorphus TaxID=672921 RepID=UPI003DA60E86